MDNRRFWKCEKGHIIGEVKRVKVGEGRHVRKLLVYEQSAAEAPEDVPPLRMKATGDVEDIHCTIEGCGCVRDWRIGEDGINALLEKRQRMLKKQSD